MYHRFLGFWTFLLSAAHGICYMLAGYDSGDLGIMAGIIAFLFLFILVLFSMQFVRMYAFNIFFRVHIITAPLFFIFVILHPGGGVMAAFLVIPLILYVVDWIARIRNYVHGELSEIRRFEDSSVIRFDFNPLKGPSKAEDRKSACGMSWTEEEPGSYYFLKIPGISRTEWHPFSTLSCPGDQSLRFYVKNLGNWTKDLLQDGKDGMSASLDGPYGKLRIPVELYSHVVIVGGGVGSIPMLSLLTHLARMHANGELNVRRVWFIWAMRHLDLVREWADIPTNAVEFAPDVFHCELYLTKRYGDATIQDLQTDFKHITVKCGRPQCQEIFQRFEHGVNVRANEIGRIGVFVCGAEGMIKNISKACLPSMDLHVERFSW
jgi:predicted ferric reductase